MDENDQAIIDWVNTFELEKPVAQLSELNDGNVLSEVLCEMCPNHFEKDSLNKETTGNWALAAGNLRKLLRMLDNYFTTVLHKRIDTSSVDVNAIAKSNDPEEMLNLLELVVGVAVMCEDKNVFIPKIFELNDHSQAVLKGLVESVMGRAEDLENPEETEEDSGSPRPDMKGVVDGVEELQLSANLTEKEQLRVKEMVQHLQAERVRLANEVSSLEQSNESLKAQLAKTKEKAQQKEQEREAVEGSDRSRVHALETLNTKLTSELEEVKREQDLKIVECETLKHDLKAVMQRLEASREIQAKLEMETHQQADELDIAKEKVAKLARAEQAVEKYQKKLEEMLELKKQNKDLCDKMDQYLDQIHSLESANKGMATLNKMVEQYKNKAVELETEKFEALSSVQTRDQQVIQLKADLDKAKEGRRQAQDECNSLRVQLEQLVEAQAVAEEGLASPGKAQSNMEDAYHTDTIPSLREKVKKLERELRMAQAGEGLVKDTTSDTNSSGSAAALHEVTLLQQELEETQTVRKLREEQLLATKKQLTEVQYELTKAQEAAAENERSADSSAQLKEVTQKLAETANTVRMLQEKLKEKESVINKVEQEKSKLENYTKRSLGTFKDKYMAVLQTLKEEKEDLQQKMRAQLDKAERNQETWHREERLISSAMFELGVRIMDQKIQSQMQHSNSAATPGVNDSFLLSAVNSPLLSPSYNNAGTFLSTQREALSRSTTDAASRNNNNQGTPNAPISSSNANTPIVDGTGRKLF
uniref:Calponin-homology (CH) domain-containing protein n=1 Tax=Spumella elongata TaxID=89044 RepID=A0A7S3HAB2_9STRA|mmetsp:Transcript_42179/g.73346  ORF Transcript_42179/g.73346 Transcript_42179/m.73346 type:complete len:761 (+) Transcript_42179:99-2381(+)|eukprot:CAMPEP_0184999022 /NCGR_PEP_ID=MMETSP1098-20130426/64240_1 /TAXON_ID=89044 /ORGANISM="Spumella elongata, Strain CCAP 955/1" /LENGTH=760 /DNA_ID=CAMNT_0027525961 /DNA_START=84 /DNA_END=2366 /DNA_ORIENTATION=+